jgi:enediyne biosynthesis protein E4
MKAIKPFYSPKTTAAWLTLAAGIWAASVRAAGSDSVISHPPANAQTLRWLADRQQQQIANAAKFKAPRDFRFTDRTGETGITFEQHSVDDAGRDWKPAHYDHGTALAVADVDGDGLADLYFVDQLGSNELWRNLGGGKWENITARAGVAVEGRIHVGASFADIDNDGDPDLFVTTVKMGNVLFENIGGGRFKDITAEAGLGYVGHSSGAVFFDFDRDGLLDLFVANVGVYTTNVKGRGGFYRSVTNAFHGHLYPERTEFSLLYKNLGGRKFKDVSAGMNLRDGSWSGDATFADLNDDGWPDLYVVNMQGDNHFYENTGGKRFTDKTAAYFPKTPWGAMGVKFFDYNLDGGLDLLITDMHSDMTDTQNRLGRTNFGLDFEKQKSDAWCTTFWTDAFLQGSSNNVFGNAFYENQGGGKFAEVSDRVHAETYWPWGVSVADLNADGYEDIFITAGMGFPFRYGINSVLLNENGTQFFDAEFLLGVEPRARNRYEKDLFVFDCSGADAGHDLCRGRSGKVTIRGSLSSRSSAFVDLDNDGDLDLVTNEMNDSPQVLFSDLSTKRKIHFIKIQLAGATSNRDGLGATVKVRAGAKTFTRFNDGKSGYLSQSSLPLYFGLGEAEKVDSIEVLWPSGKKQIVSKDIPTNTLVAIKESID